MVEIILFTCCVGDQVGFVVQFILSAHSTLSEFVQNDARVELGQEVVGEQEPAHVAQRFLGVSQVHLSSKDTSSVLCNSQLFCSEPWQSLGRCLLCSLNAAFSQG